jgi:KUP system potassium uptake protein
MMPLLKIDYTSEHMQSQIYIGSVNWLLMICVLWIIFIFGESSKLAAAYGLAVTGTIAITATMMNIIFFKQRKWVKTPFSLLLFFIAFCFLTASLSKIQHGGYWSLLIASVPFAMILIYVAGQKKLATSVTLIPLVTFLESYQEILKDNRSIKGTALYFIRDLRLIPPYIINNMLENHIIYEDNVFIVINTMGEPYGIDYHLGEPIARGIRLLEINKGYSQVISVSEILDKLGLESKVIFYGIEEIVTRSLIYRIYGFIKKNTPSFVRFYHLPPNKVHGVLTRVEI